MLRPRRHLLSFGCRHDRRFHRRRRHLRHVDRGALDCRGGGALRWFEYRYTPDDLPSRPYDTLAQCRIAALKASDRAGAPFLVYECSDKGERFLFET